MSIKTRSETLHDILDKAKKHPKGWKASFGRDAKRLSHDYYLFHPEVGVYLLKEHYKNPYEIKGFGEKIARKLDSDIDQTVTKASGDFGIIQGNMQKILRNIDKGIPPKRIFNAALKGKDLGLKIPLKGKASASEDSFFYLNQAFEAKQKKLNTTFEKMMEQEGAYSSYR